jgi:hypothetical protein
MPPLITMKTLQAPPYPRDLLFAGVSGTVLLAIKVGADGQPEQVMAVQSALLDVKGNKSVLRRAVQLLEQSAISGAKTWRFNVASKPGPVSARDMTITVPISYMADGKKPVAPGMWRTEVRVPSRPIEWLQNEPDVQTIGVADLADGEVVPVGRALTLVTQVVGTVVM